nr:hypothetical protein GCM10020185_86600 [Pseudomonas brassicacearum subsp. brassicacearum]
MQLPATDFHCRLGAAQTFTEQQLIAAAHVAGIEDRRTGIERLQVRSQWGAVLHQIGLAQQQAVRGGDLGQPFRMQALLQRGMAGVNQGDYQADVEASAQLHIVVQRGEDWRRVGQAGGLQDHPFERRDFATLTALQQAEQGVFEFATNRATDAATGQQHSIRGDFFHQQMVDADVTEFIDQQSGIAEALALQQALEQGGLAAAEETGDDVESDAHTADSK